MTDHLTISLFQTNPVWQDADANSTGLNNLIEQIPSETNLIILPEMFLTGFSMNVKQIAQTMNGKGVNWMISKAVEKNLFITGSLTIEENGSYFNRLLMVSPEGAVEWYDKRHLFTIGQEHRSFSAGDRLLISKVGNWNVMPLVCYDLRFPVWSRNLNLRYDLLIYVANWPEARKDAFLSLVKARAIENQCYVAAVNRVGLDGNGLNYVGDSVIVDPRGVFLTKLSDSEGIIQATISLNELQKFRNKFPAYLDADDFDIK